MKAFSFNFCAGAGVAALAALLALPACTATEQSAETARPSVVPVPTEVNSDADRRAIYNSGGTGTAGGRTYAVPDATPNVMRLGEEAAESNRRQRVGNLNSDDPNTTTPENRLWRVDPGAPLPDTSRFRR